MIKRILSILLTLAMVLTLLPATASAEELPDWYFLFAIFKNVDTDYRNNDGKITHVKYTLTQEEVDIVYGNAKAFETYLNQLGVINAHVDVVEIDTAIRNLRIPDSGSSYINAEQATPFLTEKVDLDRYDHVSCITTFGAHTSVGGVTSNPYENGTGHAGIAFITQEGRTNILDAEKYSWAPGYPTHEFLHFMERMSKRFGGPFNLHDIMNNFYERVDGEFEECYTDILLNRAKGTAGTGVHPSVWKYPPHAFRTVREWTIPSDVTSIDNYSYQYISTLTKVTIPSSVTNIGYAAFGDCTGLTEVIIHPGLTSIEDWAFGKCSALTKLTIPASVTSIGGAAFYQSGLKDVYYNGTEAQWNAIKIEGYNDPLTKATIHYQSPAPAASFQDVPASAYYAQSVAWAVEKGVTGGTSATTFSPGNTCTQAQILTFLWRANGSPDPSGTVSGGKYYASALQWAKEQGVIDGTLTPDSPCTRADAVTYLWRLAGSPGAGSAGFTDVASGASYASAVAWAVEKGVTGGTTATTFSPDSPCTRGQIVTFLYRALS